jgi:arabinogalactan endo-1,4-beta-galactosidase
METGYNWNTNTCSGYPGQLANDGPEPFPSTALGQKEFMLNCFNALKLVNNGECLGDLYWDPVFICVTGEGWELGQANVVGNTTLFDYNGNALPALDAFNFNN